MVEIRQLIRQISGTNPLWGAPRIHGELLKLGIDVGQTSVAKYMVRRRVPPSQGWRTFLRNHADGIAAIIRIGVTVMRDVSISVGRLTSEERYGKASGLSARRRAGHQVKRLGATAFPRPSYCQVERLTRGPYDTLSFCIDCLLA
jgi:hypothetical protein